jgi:hypothetical protein
MLQRFCNAFGVVPGMGTSEAYYNIIKQGYQDWLLPVQALSDARERSYNCIGEADVFVLSLLSCHCSDSYAI